MSLCVILTIILHFLGDIPQGFFEGRGDTLAVDSVDISDLDSTIIDQRNDFLKKALFENPGDSKLEIWGLQTLELAKILDYPKGIMVAYERLGLIYQYSYSNPFKALDYYYTALAIAEQNSKLEAFQWSIKGNIATIYYEQEEYQKALSLFEEVATNSQSSALTASLNIANIYGALDQNDSAIYYFKKALDYDQLKSNPLQLANLYSNLSLIYVQNDQPEEGVKMAEKSLNLVDSLEIDFVKPTAYANAAMAFLGVGDLDKAEILAKESLQLSENQGNIFLQKSAWGTLSDVFAAKSDFEGSLKAYKRFSVLKDSLNNQNRRVAVSRKQMAFDFDKERAQALAELEREKIVRKYSLILANLIVLILLCGVYFYKKRRDALAEKNEAEFRALVSETELKALRAQMNPHFIFNSLNSIGDYILKNDLDDAQDYLSSFGKLMRLVLENSVQKEISLSDDVAFLELYLQVENKRQPAKFNYTIHLAENLEAQNILVPPMLLQPFVENCIWHAFPGREENGEININYQKLGDFLHCKVEDNGIGRKVTSLGLGKKSKGISITESRIRILNEQSGLEGKLQITDKPEGAGTIIEIIIPLNLAY
ncbi:tetratricopeptide repeat-containing sensor histidine kinase [Algoriphagus halophytocola]|uniref:Histidine kinase n=1 Tax=Algoriphagus halophytocola TaxID=2991499 RepID=A0ABY6MIF8_9BACT|nr:histidine kinase [Algoriphagus sp. TR-M5]UZD23565.1 histidine kinase [Algoriphagus sp. TR-M5]